MRVVSMVPSWTETLIEAGVNIVGRTRFCIHPAEQVAGIPVVGGTKNTDIDRLRATKPDILILDKEENPEKMAALQYKFFASHICSISNVAPALRQMRVVLQSSELDILADRWEKIIQISDRFEIDPLGNLPIIEWLTDVPVFDQIASIHYVIWQNPWMVVSADTFIGTMLATLGFSSHLRLYEIKYPKLEWHEINQRDHLILFSSEPYPFRKQKSKIPPLIAKAAIVDGEKLGWFGIRSLQFLESQLVGRSR